MTETTLSTMTDREAFCMVLSHGPLLPCDVLVVPSGDGIVRVEVAEGILRQRAAEHVVVSGGVDKPPYSLHADDLARQLIARGLSPDRLIRDVDSMNTHEQAKFAITLAEEREWSRLLLAISPYHAPRLFLTFLRELLAHDLRERLHMMIVPAGHTSWFRAPDGRDTTRVELLAEEFDKIDRYGAKGHVATYAEGLDYLRLWEGVE